MTTQTRYPTPEEAAAAVRDGRPGFILCIRGLASGMWTGMPDPLYETAEEASRVAVAAMVRINDTARVAMIGPDGSPLPVQRFTPYQIWVLHEIEEQCDSMEAAEEEVRREQALLDGPLFKETTR
jgi:hypothetical protein